MLDMKIEKYIDSDGSELLIERYEHSSYYFNSNSKLHRLDGPAVYSPRNCEYWNDNLLHRIGGPAIITNYPSWWVNGNRVEAYYIYG